MYAKCKLRVAGYWHYSPPSKSGVPATCTHKTISYIQYGCKQKLKSRIEEWEVDKGRWAGKAGSPKRKVRLVVLVPISNGCRIKGIESPWFVEGCTSINALSAWLTNSMLVEVAIVHDSIAGPSWSGQAKVGDDCWGGVVIGIEPLKEGWASIVMLMHEVARSNVFSDAKRRKEGEMRSHGSC